MATIASLVVNLGMNTAKFVEGTGKAKHDVAIHTCGADVKADCCASN